MENLTARLRDILHLNKNEAKIYAILLDQPSLDVKELASESGVSVSRVYEVLNALASRGLIEKKQQSSNIRVISPDIAVQNIKRQERQALEQRELAISELQTMLQRVWEDSVTNVPAMGVQLIPFESVEPFFLNKIQHVETRILIAASSSTPSVNFRSAGESLAKLTGTGIDIRYLVNSDSLATHLSQIFAHSPPFDKLDIQIQANEDLATSFVILDDELFLFFFGSDETKTMVLRTISRSLVQTMSWTYCRLWEK